MNNNNEIMKAKFKVGDKVRVLPRTGKPNDYRSAYMGSMLDCVGKVFTIAAVELSDDPDASISDDGYSYTLKEDEMDWSWDSSMLELVEENEEDIYSSLSNQKQYFYLIMKDGEPYRINLNPHKILRDARAIVTTEPEAKVSIYRNLIATTSKCELVIDNIKPYKNE